MAKKKAKPGKKGVRKPAAEIKGPIRPSALTPAQLARLLTQASGEKVTVEQIRGDIEAGAPTNGDGMLHVLHYTAWLASVSV